MLIPACFLEALVFIIHARGQTIKNARRLLTNPAGVAITIKVTLIDG